MTSKDNKLTFGKGNMKLKHTAVAVGLKKSHVVVFSLPAGFTCPSANLCHSRTVIDAETEKRKRQDFGQFVCYATKAELLYTNVYNARHKNWRLLQEAATVENMVALIQQSLPKNAKLVRIHDSGDFYHKRYYQAWKQVAENNPNIRFFAYTKMLPYAVNARESGLDNFFVQYSYGGLLDKMRDRKFSDIPTCYVITEDDWLLSEDRKTATSKIDGRVTKVVCDGKEAGHEDYLAIVARESFGIIFH